MAEDKRQQIIDTIKEMSVMELSDLVKELEEVFDVSAQAPVAVAGAVAGGAAEEAEEQTEFDVILKDFGKKKIQVIKTVRSISGLGLKEAKQLVDGAPNPVVEGVEKDEAEKVKSQIEEAGGTAEIK